MAHSIYIFFDYWFYFFVGGDDFEGFKKDYASENLQEMSTPIQQVTIEERNMSPISTKSDKSSAPLLNFYPDHTMINGPVIPSHTELNYLWAYNYYKYIHFNDLWNSKQMKKSEELNWAPALLICVCNFNCIDWYQWYFLSLKKSIWNVKIFFFT